MVFSDFDLITNLSVRVIQKVRLLADQKEATEIISQLFTQKKAVVLSFVNAHAFNLCHKDLNFCNALLDSDLILRDGIGMKILFSLIGVNAGANLNGTDYIPMLLNKYKGRRLALIGTESRYLYKATKKLTTQGHSVVLCATGFHKLQYYLDLVKSTKPEIIIIGMGMPKQEILSILLRDVVDQSCLIINGGAILDFMGCKIYRAPLWMRKIKLEWLFRLMQEPKRLFSRYIIGNLIFLLRSFDLGWYRIRRQVLNSPSKQV